MIATIAKRTLTDDQMAKRKQSEPMKARKQELSVESLQDQLGKCRMAMASMETLLQNAEKNGIKSIAVDGATQLDRAAVLLEGFSDNLVKGFNQAKRQAKLRHQQGQND